MSTYKRARKFIEQFSWGRFLLGHEPLQATPVRKARPIMHNLTPQKQAELKRLCERLFQNKALVTSGKLQLIGLDSVKKRLGKQWEGMATVVYEITENAIRKYLGKDDLFIRYTDNTYAIIFARGSLIEGQQKAIAIVNEIREQIFALDEADLKNLEVREALKQISADFSTGQGFTDFLDELTKGWQEEPEYEEKRPSKAEETSEEAVVNPHMVETDTYRLRVIPSSARKLSDMSVHYQPLWDVPRNALTTYMCLSYPKNQPEMKTFEAHKGLYEGLIPEKILELDLHVLKSVMNELESMDRDGRKLLIACPVHYQTLYRYEGYEVYKAQLSRMLEEHRQYLIIYVMGTPEAFPAKSPFWFNISLRNLCRQLILELPLSRDINFSLVKGEGIKAVAVALNPDEKDEQDKIKMMNNFSARATGANIQMMAIMGVSTLSLTTSAVCAGFKLLGGNAIHDPVESPDTVHRYRHEDLIKNLTQN